MKRSRWIFAGGGALLALVAVVFAAAYSALNSEVFARWLLDQIAARSDGALRVESVRGTLNGGLQIEAAEVDLGAGSATLQSVEFRLDWRSLIARSVVLDNLDIDRLEVAIRETEASAAESQPADFSMLVLIRMIRIGEVAIAVDEGAYSLYDVATELRLLRNRLELNSLSVVYDQATLSGNAAFTLTDAWSIESDICIDGVLSGEFVVGCVAAAGTQAALQLNAEIQSPFAATAVGTVALTESGFVDLALTWQDAAVASFPDVGSARGTAQVTGSPERLRVAAQGVLRYRSETADFDGSAVVGAQTMEIERLRLEQLPASAEITGSAARDLSAADLDVAIRAADPQRWLPDWPGDLDLSAHVAVTVTPELSIAAQDVVVSGELREYPLAATGALGYSDAGLAIDAFRIVSRSEQVTLSGRVGESLDLELDASIADIGIALAGASGSLTAELAMTGSIDKPLIRGRVDMEEVGLEDLSAHTLRIAGVAGFAAADPVDVAISAADLDISGTSISESIVSVAGTGAAHRLQARLQAQNWNVSLASDGAFLGQAWQGVVDRLEFSPGDFGVWRLTAPADVSYGAGAYSISDLCLSYTLSRICASVSVSGSSEDSLRVEAVNFDVGILEPFLPSEIRAKGLVDGRGELANFIADPRGEVVLEAADAQVDIALAEEVYLPIPVEQLSLGALFDESGATLSMSLNAAEVGSATAALLVRGNPRQPDSRLEGMLDLQWQDAAALALLSPDVEDVEGRMAAMVSLGGTVAEPLIGGTGRWIDGSLTVPAWAVVIDGIAASIDSNGGEEALFEARGNIDGTPVEIDGTVLLDPERGWPMQLRLSGENLSLVQLAGIEIVVSPELEADVQLPRIQVGGRVRIPSAHISDVALPQQAVVPSADAVIHGRTVEERARPIDLVAALTLELGDDVTIEDANLSASVTGRLDLDYRSGVGAAAEGQLTVSGEYVAYGNPLALERGQLIFVGPLDDPSLDIRAVRQFRDITLGEVTVGAQLTGTLRSPVTTLFSDPTMTEAETLSWLLLGQPLESAREPESRALRNAALSMGLQQALPAIERFGESLGFDEFAIRTSETDVSALMAGKYLGPNVYFQYSYGLFNRIGGVLLRYRISDRFSLETRSGEHRSMDLLYTVEKD